MRTNRPAFEDRPHLARREPAAAAASGFTLAEVATAAAIVGVLAALVVPIVGGTIHAARASAARSAVIDTYRSAIRHASTRGVHVVACPASDGHCADGVDWSAGWLLFEDRDGDRERGDNERLVSSWPRLAPKVHLRSTAGRKRLVFQPNGGNAGSNVTLTLCDGRGAKAATQLVLANDGRLREATPSLAVARACVLAP